MYNKYFVDIVFIIKNAVTIDSSICQTKDYDPSVPETYSSWIWDYGKFVCIV